MFDNWKTIQITKRQQRKKEFWQSMFRPNRNPCFEFTKLESTERLVFEIMDEVNYLDVFEIFQNDRNPFVLEDYKNLEKWEQYADGQLYMSRFSCKHGACDWLIKLKTTQQTIGILNIHELNRETYNDFHKQCMIGYSIAADFRRQGYATEAVKRLIPYAFAQFDLNKLIANTEKGNTASQSLLLKLDFVESETDFYYNNKYDYFELSKLNTVFQKFI